MQPRRRLTCEIIDGEARRDDRVLAFLLIVLGGVRIAVAIANGETAGTEATIAAVMTILGLRLLARR